MILASASPRRAALLAQIGVAFTVHAVDIDEIPGVGEDALGYSQRIAHAKSVAARTELGDAPYILTADTEVVLDGRIYGKPADAAAAQHMLHSLSAATHDVFSTVVIRRGDRVAARSQHTRVSMAALPAAWIERYILSGQPLGKAGAYAIQSDAARYIERIDGSYSSVMGLPLYETGQLLDLAATWTH